MENIEKVREQNSREVSIQQIIERELAGKVIEQQELTGGYYGHVYKVQLENQEGSREVIIKFVHSEAELEYNEETIDNRVYGSRWSNLKPSHELLSVNKLPVPQLLGDGSTENGDESYVIMEYISGKATKDLLLLEDTPAIEELHELVGDTLGKMHAITRDFQGWVNMHEAYEKKWKDAFFESIVNHVERASKHNKFVAINRDKIAVFIEKMKQDWIDPQTFVFSHTDGFQGMAEYYDDEWKLNGIIDVEDNEFTDQRFVLAGHELIMEYSKKEVLPEFWEAYQAHNKVEESFDKSKNLFKLYYVLCWTSVASEGWRGTPEEQVKAFGRLEELIGEYIK